MYLQQGKFATVHDFRKTGECICKVVAVVPDDFVVHVLPEKIVCCKLENGKDENND